MDAGDSANTIRPADQLELIVARTSRLLREIDEIEMRIARLEVDLYLLRGPWLTLQPLSRQNRRCIG